MAAGDGEIGHGPRHDGQVPGERADVRERRGRQTYPGFVDVQTGFGDLLDGKLEAELFDGHGLEAQQLVELA